MDTLTILSAVLVAITGVYAFLTFKMSRTMERQRLDSTLPVLVYQLQPEVSDDLNVFEIVVRLLNMGSGVALNVHQRWEPVSVFVVERLAEPIALAPGGIAQFSIRGSKFPLMLHDIPGGGPERRDPVTNEAFMRLGAMHAAYEDVHGRTIKTSAQIEVAFDVLGDDPGESGVEGWVRVDRNWALVGPRCFEMKFERP